MIQYSLLTSGRVVDLLYLLHHVDGIVYLVLHLLMISVRLILRLLDVGQLL